MTDTMEALCVDLAERKGACVQQADEFIELVVCGFLGFLDDREDFDRTFLAPVAAA